MASVKIERLQAMIQRDVAQIVATGLRDPRMRFGCVTRVKLTPDLKHAKVYVSCLGTDTDKRTFMKGLESARGRIQAIVSRHMRTRLTPQLHFEYDEGIERSVRVATVIDRAVAEDRANQAARGEPVAGVVAGSAGVAAGVAGAAAGKIGADADDDEADEDGELDEDDDVYEPDEDDDEDEEDDDEEDEEDDDEA